MNAFISLNQMRYMVQLLPAPPEGDFKQVMENEDIKSGRQCPHCGHRLDNNATT